MRVIDVIFGILFIVFIVLSYIHTRLTDTKILAVHEEVKDLKKVLLAHVNFESTIHYHTDEMDIIDEHNLPKDQA